MQWIELKSKVKQLLNDRELAKPKIRLNALEKLETLIKSNYPRVYNNPMSLLKIDRIEFKKMLSKHKKLNSAESSIINNFYQILSNSKSSLYNKKAKSSKVTSVKTSKSDRGSKPIIVSSEKEMDNPIYGLKPVVDDKTKILILGTFPAKESLDEIFYYKNPSNRFWSQALNCVSSFEKMPDEEKKRKLFEKGIGLWDIFECAERDESNQDKSLEKAKYNNIKKFLNKHATIKYLIFNGANAFNWLKEDRPKVFNIDKIETKRLQSSSGGNGHFNQGKDWEEYVKKIL